MRLDAILVVVELLVQPRVHHRQVIALEVVVDVDLPVAGDLVVLPHHPPHALGVEVRRALRDVLEEIAERRGLRIDVDEDERTPACHLHRLQVHVGGREALHTFHLRRAKQIPLQVVRPPVVLALERLPLAAAVCDRTGTVQADVVKRAQRIAIAKDDERLARDFGGEELSALRDLLRPPDELPCPREDLLALELEIDGIDVEPSRNRRRVGDVGVEGEVDGHRSRGPDTRGQALGTAQ